MSHEEDLERQREIEKADGHYSLSTGLMAFLFLACVSLASSIGTGAEHGQGTLIASIVTHALVIGGTFAGIIVNEIKGRRIVKPKPSHHIFTILSVLCTVAVVWIFLR